MKASCWDVPDQWEADLKSLLVPARVAVVPPDDSLVEAAAQYVLAGGTPPNLSSASGHQVPASYNLRNREVARRFYSDSWAVCGHVWARWAYVLLLVDHHERDWPEALVAHLDEVHTGGRYRRNAPAQAVPIPFDFADLERVLTAGDGDVGDLVERQWRYTVPRRYRRSEVPEVLTGFRGYDDIIAGLHSRLAPVLLDADLDVRLQGHSMLAPVADEVLARYAATLARAVVAGAAKVREAALPLVTRVAESARGPLWDVATGGASAERGHALALLWDLAPNAPERDRVRQTAEADRAASVRALADSLGEPAAPTVWPDLPAPREPEWATEPVEEVRRVVASFVAEHRGYWSKPRRGNEWETVNADEASRIFLDLLAEDAPCSGPRFDHVYAWQRSPSLRDGLVDGVVTAEAAVKMLIACDLLRHSHDDRDLIWTAGLLHHHQGLTLLDLAALLDASGLDGAGVVIAAWFRGARSALGSDWAPETVWPFVAEHLDRVLELATRHRGGAQYLVDSAALFPALRTLPVLPTDVVEFCYAMALGAHKSDQRAAQDFLSVRDDAVPRAVAALQDGNGVVRAVAAEWLSRLADRSVVPVLAAAQATERNETTQGTMLEALVALGEDVTDHLDLASLDAKAATAMTKGLPAALDWLQPSTLPAVRRAGGDEVPRDTMTWLVVRAVAARSSVPSAVLLACVSQLGTGDARRFANALLGLWITADEETVRQYAEHYNVTPHTGHTSGAPSRGLLALVAACGGPDSVVAAARYLRTWHGQRAAQSKALLTMLAHHRDPSATEVLVAIAYRFKAPSIERHAREEVTALAERRGWTMDELADRTVTTCGFGDDGRLVLSYGDRDFTARLTPQLDVDLVDADGEPIKALPAARAGEDVDTVKEARSALSSARKQLKQTSTRQRLRLRDAMCAQRVWRSTDWQRDLAGHPVMARLVGRLLWVAEGGERRTFRLLEDGTLTDVDDEPVILADDDRLRIAHDVTLTDEEITVWRQHMADYEVPTLFAQLGRGRAGLSGAEEAATSLRGPRDEIPISSVERACEQHGYRRGVVGDAAAYDWFEKQFEALSLEVRIGIEGGVEVFDHESKVRIEDLSFLDLTSGGPRSLGEVPPVLLVESRHDLAEVTGTPAEVRS